jgi:hypothetical protein
MINVVSDKYNNHQYNFEHNDFVRYLIDILPLMDPVVLNSQNFDGMITLDYLLIIGVWYDRAILPILEKITWDIFQPDKLGRRIYDRIQSGFSAEVYSKFLQMTANSYMHSIKEANADERSEWEKECVSLEGHPKEQLLATLKRNKIKVPKNVTKEDVCILLAKYQIERKRKSYAGTRLFELFKKVNIIIKPKKRFNPIIWRGNFVWEWLLNKYICNKHANMINNHFPTLHEFLKPVKEQDALDALFAFVWKKENGKETLIPPMYLKPASLRKSGLKQFSHFPFIITYTDNEAHENSIIVDHKNKTVERFEPHGYKGAHYYNTRQLTIKLKKYFKKVLPEYTFLDSKDIYPRRGVQTYENIAMYHDISYEMKPGYCAAWSAWYMDLICTNWDIISKFRTRQEFINAALVKIHHQFSSAQKYILMYIDHTKVYQKLNKIVEKVPFFAKQGNPIDYAHPGYVHIDSTEGDSPENRAAVQFRKLLYTVN